MRKPSEPKPLSKGYRDRIEKARAAIARAEQHLQNGERLRAHWALQEVDKHIEIVRRWNLDALNAGQQFE